LPAFYANLFAKVFGYLEMNDPEQDWRAVAIFLERRFEPTEREPYRVLLDSPRVTRIYLDELPPQSDPPLALGIWEIVSAPRDRVREVAPKVVRKAAQELTDTALRRQVIQLVEEFLIKRFTSLKTDTRHAGFARYS
jgi:predicted transposase YdaD